MYAARKYSLVLTLPKVLRTDFALSKTMDLENASLILSFADAGHVSRQSPGQMVERKQRMIRLHARSSVGPHKPHTPRMLI